VDPYTKEAGASGYRNNPKNGEVLPLPNPGIAVETRPGAGFCSGLVGPAASSAVDV